MQRQSNLLGYLQENTKQKTWKENHHQTHKKTNPQDNQKRSQTSNHKTKGSTHHQAYRKANHQHHQNKHQSYTAHLQHQRKFRTNKSRGNPPFNHLRRLSKLITSLYNIRSRGNPPLNHLRRLSKPITSLYNIRVPITISIFLQHNKMIVIKKRIVAKSHNQIKQNQNQLWGK